MFVHFLLLLLELKSDCFCVTGTFPIDTTKTRLQIQGQKIDARFTDLKYRGMFHAFFRILREEGAIALYSGYVKCTASLFASLWITVGKILAVPVWTDLWIRQKWRLRRLEHNWLGTQLSKLVFLSKMTEISEKWLINSSNSKKYCQTCPKVQTSLLNLIKSSK